MLAVAFCLSWLCQPCEAQLKGKCPEGWKRVSAKEYFTFCLPPGLKQDNKLNIESFSGGYTSDNLRFYFDYEPYDFLSYEFRHEKEMLNYEETEIKFDDRKAVIRTYETRAEGSELYKAELHIGDWEKSKIELEMVVVGKNADVIETAKKIFLSVDFLKN